MVEDSDLIPGSTLPHLACPLSPFLGDGVLTFQHLLAHSRNPQYPAVPRGRRQASFVTTLDGKTYGCLGLPDGTPTWPLTPGPAVAQPPGHPAPARQGCVGWGLALLASLRPSYPLGGGSLAPLGSFGYDSGQSCGMAGVGATLW